ncbi:La domain-containingfamily [Purpureocillium lavendulum]|uniref:La domain-containingfamily n=1 Tax=Purpureocillium lavendulum TaxID=1247861 RepID=A0AB34G458_9HYPO|nr:La domain-containingfamily [Purpureocillium lavendulum]
MAAPSAFSYAQAAKGQNTPPSTTSSATQAAQPPASESAPSTVKSSTVAESTASPVDSARTVETTAPAAERQEIDSNIGSESDLRSDATPDKRSESKRDDDTSRLDRPWRRADKSTRSSSTATRSVDEQDSRRPRKNKKTKSSDKQPGDQAAEAEKEQEPVPEPPKIELAEAPIPSVNIWHQRKEAHLAKAKPATATSEVVTNGEPATVAGEDAKKTVKPNADTSPLREAATVASTNGTKPPRKTSEVTRPERNGSRGSRVVEKDAKESKSELPPPVDDSSSWPTPEISIKEEKKKPVTATVDRPEKEVKDAQDDASQAKPRQKEKWVAYDYVPSVSFETQIPQMRNSKPRGGARGANSTRSPAGANTADKTAPATTATKTGESRDRARESTGGASTRAASLPPTAKRASMDLSNAKDQKKAPGHAPGEKTKDAASAHQAEQSGARDRHEGRNERGRGGFRGRGGHHSINSTHSQHQHNGSAFASGSMTSRPQGPYSPPPRQGGHNQMFMPPPPRGGRGRNAAGANFHHRMSLPNGATRPPAVQTQFGPYDFPMAPLSAMPFQAPYWDSVVMQMLKSQIEYYFSIENLCKDMYLRKRMDSQGFVNLHFVTAFKRIRELTSDMGMIRAVCEASVELDYIVGEDEIERLRRRSNWQTFVLPMEERDDFARNNGPSHITFKNRPYNFGAFNGMPPAPYGVSPPLGYNPQSDAPFQQLPDRHGVNGMVNGGAASHGAPTQLSAEVPDFSPSGLTAAVGLPASLEADKTAVDVGNDSKTAAEASTKALPNGVHAEEMSEAAQS